MARGPSGRIVIEIEPALKRELHSALVADGETLKDWFIAQARGFLRERRQPALPGLARFPAPSQGGDSSGGALRVAEEGAPYSSGKTHGGRREASAPASTVSAPSTPPFSDE